MSSNRFTSALRSFFTTPVAIFTYLYAISLTCSMSGMEIAGWNVFLFTTIFIIVDRLNTKPTLEIHTLGVELPILGFFITVIVGLKINAPNSDFWDAFGNLRNFILLYALTYALQITRNLNRIFNLILFFATIFAMYGIWQHYSGTDLLASYGIRINTQALFTAPWAAADVFQTIGTFSHHLTFGHSYAMILCFSWAAILLMNRRVSWPQAVFFFISFAVILTAVIFTYGRGVWIALLVSLPLMALFTNKKLFFGTVALLATITGVLYFSDPGIRQRASTILGEGHNIDRKEIWQINIEMFNDHPWIGVGYKQNENLSAQYYEKAGIKDGVLGHAHSNYIQALSTTGFLGFAFYMLFAISFVLMTHRLYLMIPNTHYWHKVFALAALGAQITFHVGGLTQWNFGDLEVQHQYFFWLAVVAYMTQKYSTTIVSDDYNL